MNVLVGKFGRQVIGPFSINCNRNPEVNLNMLQNQILPAIYNESGQNFPTSSIK